MKKFNFSSCTLRIAITVAFLTACTGTQPQISAPNVLSLSPALAKRAEQGRPWILPEAKDQNLLYAAADNAVYVYTYPRGRLVGALGSFNGAEGLCADKAGDVFVTAFYDAAVYEYPHGSTKQIAVLGSPYPVLDCSVDPKTGDVAVAVYPGAVIFPYTSRHGYGFAKFHPNPLLEYGSTCSYDDQENLFVDGVVSFTSGFGLSELPKGSKTFKSITLNQNIAGPGSLQWKGKTLSAEDSGPGGGSSPPAVLYRFAISGGYGTKVGTTTLADSTADAQFWIQGNKVIGPEAGSNSGIGLWSYPPGGAPSKTIFGFPPNGVVVSLK